MTASCTPRTCFLDFRRPFIYAAFGIVLATCACERQEHAAVYPAQSQPVVAAPRRPELTFPAEMRAAAPEISAFLDRFLDAWLNGNYPAYRRLVSRAHTPENRERFELISAATAAVTVEAVDLIETPRLPPPAYLAVFHVELTPDAAERRGESTRKIAIIVFKELEQWKMAAAPAEYQPKAPAPASAPAAPPASAPAPEYPWDEEGDY